MKSKKKKKIVAKKEGAKRKSNLNLAPKFYDVPPSRAMGERTISGVLLYSDIFYVYTIFFPSMGFVCHAEELSDVI